MRFSQKMQRAVPRKTEILRAEPCGRMLPCALIYFVYIPYIFRIFRHFHSNLIFDFLDATLPRISLITIIFGGKNGSKRFG